MGKSSESPITGGSWLVWRTKWRLVELRLLKRVLNSLTLPMPGLNLAAAHYAKLAGGDPDALARENAPAIQQITGQSNEQLSNIMQNSPRGGARDLAISEADVAKGAKISDLTTRSYTSAFPSLASLGGQNVGQGNQATSTGIQGMNAAANQYGNIQQLQNAAKATGLGAMSGGLGDIAMFAAM